MSFANACLVADTNKAVRARLKSHAAVPRLKLALSSTASGEESKITPFDLHSGIKPKLESHADVIIIKTRDPEQPRGLIFQDESLTNLFLTKDCQIEPKRTFITGPK